VHVRQGGRDAGERVVPGVSCQDRRARKAGYSGRTPRCQL